MGLDTSFDCWHGPYSAFMRWRTALAEAAHYPPLMSMEGFQLVPTKNCNLWEDLPDDPLKILLSHSDCDGDIAAEDCLPIAQRLEELAPLMGEWSARTLQFATGLREAAAAGEDVNFH